MKEFFSKVLIALGICSLLISIYFIWQRNSPSRLAFALDNYKYNQNTSTNFPREILIEDLGIHLPIIPTSLVDSKWNATTEGISYLENSPRPGEIGNSILYGHNFPNLLGNLSKIKPGIKIVIRDNDGSQKTFIVEYTSVVTPDQTHVLKNSTDQRITLYTCTGFLDTKRFVVVALLEK